MARKIGAILGGIVMAVLIIWIVELIGHQLYPVAGGIDLSDPASMDAFMASMPAEALLFVAAAWFLGALGGGIVAARIGRERWMAWAIAGVIALASIANVLMFPHPLWMKVAGFAAPLLGGLLSARMARPKVIVEGANDARA